MTESAYNVLKRLGFEDCKRNSLFQKLSALNPTGRTALRDSLLIGLQIVYKIYEELKNKSTTDDYNIIHIVITDGGDTCSKTSETQIESFLKAWNQKFGNSLCQTVLVGIALNANTNRDLNKLCIYGGESFRTFNVENDNISEIFKRISIELGMVSETAIAYNQQGVFMVNKKTPFMIMKKKKVALLLNLDFSSSMKGFRWTSLIKNAYNFVNDLTPGDLLTSIIFNDEVKILDHAYQHRQIIDSYNTLMQAMGAIERVSRNAVQNCLPITYEPEKKANAVQNIKSSNKNPTSQPNNNPNIPKQALAISTDSKSQYKNPAQHKRSNSLVKSNAESPKIYSHNQALNKIPQTDRRPVVSKINEQNKKDLPPSNLASSNAPKPGLKRSLSESKNNPYLKSNSPEKNSINQKPSNGNYPVLNENNKRIENKSNLPPSGASKAFLQNNNSAKTNADYSNNTSKISKSKPLSSAGVGQIDKKNKDDIKSPQLNASNLELKKSSPILISNNLDKCNTDRPKNNFRSKTNDNPSRIEKILSKTNQKTDDKNDYNQKSSRPLTPKLKKESSYSYISNKISNEKSRDCCTLF